MEAGGVTGVTVLLWVTEKCKQTMLERTAACECQKSSHIGQAYMYKAQMSDAVNLTQVRQEKDVFGVTSTAIQSTS